MKVHEHYKQLWVNKFGACAITVGSHIFYDIDKPFVDKRIRKHEMVHIEQYKKYGLIGFLVIYLYQYLLGRLQGKSHFEAYEAIPFEVEARKGEYK